MTRFVRRLRRRAVWGLCPLSLLATLGLGWLWWRSERSISRTGDRISVYMVRAGKRFTLRSEWGRLRLYGPPAPSGGLPPSVAPNGETAESEAAKLDDRRIVWNMIRFIGPDHTGRPWAYMNAPMDEMYGALAPTPPLYAARGAVTPALLRRLEDPQRALSAHWLLLALHGGSPRRVADVPRPDGSVVTWSDGLRITARPVGQPVAGTNNGVETLIWPAVASAEPVDWPTVGERWHRRLDVALGSVPYWLLVGLSAAPAAAWVGRRARRTAVRQRRRRLGLCLSCGYDLRGSAGAGRCSECGQAIVGRTVSAGMAATEAG